MEKALFIIRGLPGSGKTTVAEMLANISFGVGKKKDGEYSYTVCTADDFFMKDGEYVWKRELLGAAHKWCQDKCKNAMIAGEDRIFIANTNTTWKEMKIYFDMANEFGYFAYSLIVENRHGGVNKHNVPVATLEAMANRFEIKLK